MPQALSGTRKSVPKICRINGDDNLKVVYRNLGNNHAYPFVWADEFTMVSGTAEIVIASGIKFHGYDLATYGNVTASPLSDPEARWYIDKNTTTNVIKIKSTASLSAGDVKFDVKFMIGADFATGTDVGSIYCRGNRGAAPCYP